MCCLHKTHKVRLLILLDKNFLQEKAMLNAADFSPGKGKQDFSSYICDFKQNCWLIGKIGAVFA